MTTDAIPAELAALLAALDDAEPEALTSCPGWTAHHLAAHIVGNHEEARRHVEAFLAGRPLTSTRSFEEREQPWRERSYAELLRAIPEQAEAMAAVLGEISEKDPDAELLWTRRTVAVAKFPTHMRSEAAVHRWDLVGDDPTSAELLGQQELLDHAVTFIGAPLLARGVAHGAAEGMWRARVRTPGRPDLVVAVDNGTPRLTVEPAADAATLEGDAAARLLLLWGRKPQPFPRLRAVAGPDAAGRVQQLLAGY